VEVTFVEGNRVPPTKTGATTFTLVDKTKHSEANKMIYATKIKMNYGYFGSNRCIDINSIYLSGEGYNGYREKAWVHDYVRNRPGSVCVNLGMKPSLIDAKSSYGEKYVRSEPNHTPNDNLLKLPRE
jgi:hypothetical protein